MDDLPCVTISAVGGSEFMVKAEVHHVPISGTFVHTFAGSRNAPDLYGVLEFKIVDEQGIPTGVPLLTVAVDAEGNCGWRGRIEDLHTFLPINLEAARFQRTAILNALRWKVQELLVERAKLPE
ncbi:hypothetical protein LMG6871_00337 [Ralstonia edaphis]|nr:hypothetical protein LMG6871_00337 [Ralstonia sp. LMG 6871]